MSHIREYIIAVLIVAVIYFVWEDGKTFTHSQKRIDSLQVIVRQAKRERDLAVDSANHYKIMADSWYEAAQKTPKAKVIIRTIYANDTSRNRSLSLLQRDSIIRATF